MTTHTWSIIGLVVVMVLVIVTVDVLFFRNQFTERLIANIGIALVFIAAYFLFFR